MLSNYLTQNASNANKTYMKQEKIISNRTTLLDIANDCNLSKATVSRVLNGNAGNFYIATGTREKVLKSAKELNYRPNRLARAINDRRTHLIGMSVSSCPADTPKLEMELADAHRRLGVFFVAITHHPLFKKYDLVVHNRMEYTDLPLNEIDVEEDLLDGMIYINPSTNDLPFLKSFNQNIPLIIIGNIQELHDSVICVDVNNRKMAKQAAEHLLSIGRKNILLLVPEGVLSAYCIQDRIDGYRDAHEEVGLKANPDLTRILRADAATVSDFILTSPAMEHVDAILCLTGLMAQDCLDPLKKRGFRVPEDIALMGFDLTGVFNPGALQLSTVGFPCHAMAYEATGRLLSILENGEPYVPGFYEVPAELIIRGSTVKN